MSITSRQCEIAAESLAACLLSLGGFDIFIQYGADQPGYDIVAVRDARSLFVSVKGSTLPGWVLRTKKKELTYSEGIDLWAQKHETRNPCFLFVRFQKEGSIKDASCYVATFNEVLSHIRAKNYGVIKEKDIRDWAFTPQRLEGIFTIA